MPEINNQLQKLDGQLRSLEIRVANQIGTQSWRDLKHDQHDRAFVVAGAMKADLLNDLATAVNDSISKGLGIDYFREQFDAIVAKHGWQFKGDRNWRTRVIFNTNLRVSYAAGRLEQLRDPELRKLKPFWMYRHSGAEHPRMQHLAWDKLTLPADDPWFRTHYPPNGWGCGCRVTAVSARDIARLGGRIEKPPEGTDGIDEGWDYMPGASVVPELENIVEQKTNLPPELQAEVRAQLARIKASRAAISEVVRLGKASPTDREFSMLINRAGESELIEGQRYATQFTDAQLQKMRDGVLVHNHPMGSGLSAADLVLAKQRRVTVTAAGHGGEIYTATVLDNELTSELFTVTTKAEQLLGKQVQSEQDRWYSHLVCRLLAKRGVLHYHFNILEPRWLTELIARA